MKVRNLKCVECIKEEDKSV